MPGFVCPRCKARNRLASRPTDTAVTCAECGHAVRLAMKRQDSVSEDHGSKPSFVETNRNTNPRPWRRRLRMLAFPLLFLLGGFLGYAFGSAVWFNAGARLATRYLMKINDLQSQLDQANISVRNAGVAMQQAERALQKGRDISREDAKLTRVAESAVKEIYGHLIEPIYLRDLYKIHKKTDSWIVEGIVLEGRTDTSEACFWAVQIVSSNSAADNLIPREYEARQVIFNLHLNERSPQGEWIEKGIIPIKKPHNYPRIEFE